MNTQIQVEYGNNCGPEAGEKLTALAIRYPRSAIHFVPAAIRFVPTGGDHQ
jgi:hypothetical protein